MPRRRPDDSEEQRRDTQSLEALAALTAIRERIQNSGGYPQDYGFADDNGHIHALTPEQLELRDYLNGDSSHRSPTGRNQSEPIGGIQWATPTPYRGYASGGRIRTSRNSGNDAIPATIGRTEPYTVNAYNSNTSGLNRLSWNINYYPEGNEMPRLAIQQPLVERLKTELEERKREVRAQVDSSITQMERALSSLREAVGYLNEEDISVTYMEECKYIVRSARENLSRASRAINPAPAIFTNMVRQSRNLVAETDRIRNERAEAQAEERALQFAEALAATTDYVPSEGDYVMIPQFAAGPCRIMQVTPSVGTPSSLDHASFAFTDSQGGMAYTRSLSWMRSNGLVRATEEQLQMLPQFYIPSAGDVIELPNGLSGNDPTDITVFTVDHVTQDTTVFDDDGRPNPNVRLTTAANPDGAYTRRVARLRALGMRRTDREDVAPANVPDTDLQVGDNFRCNRATTHIDSSMSANTVFEVVGTSDQLVGRGVRFRVLGGNYVFERTMPELREAGLVGVIPGANSSWVPVVGDVIRFNGSMRYHVTGVEFGDRVTNPIVSFYAENDRRVERNDGEPYTYRYPMSELRTLGLRPGN
jgi:hypothetical protein